jgi:hypothetical protein
MDKFWNWLNGKKMIIGGLCIAFVTYLRADSMVSPHLGDFLFTAAGIIFGVGAGHKIVKYREGQ